MKDIFPAEIFIFIHTESYFYSHGIIYFRTQISRISQILICHAA